MNEEANRLAYVISASREILAGIPESPVKYLVRDLTDLLERQGAELQKARAVSDVYKQLNGTLIRTLEEPDQDIARYRKLRELTLDPTSHLDVVIDPKNGHGRKFLGGKDLDTFLDAEITEDDRKEFGRYDE